MAEFTVSIANIPIRIKPLLPEIKSYFTEYLCEEEERFTVETTEDDLEYEREYSDRIYAEEDRQQWPPRYLETLALLRKIANQAVEYDTILFHGAVVAFEGKAYLFTAPSGTGKTTHIRLWLGTLPGAYILNGDKPFLQIGKDGSVLACGTPWRGKEHYGRNEILPLEGICLLERDTYNHIQTITPKESVNRLLRQTYIPPRSGAMIKTISILDQISKGVRLYRLGCNMEPEAAEVSIGAMVRGNSEGWGRE